MAKRTFCDGCGNEVTSTTRQIDIVHTFPNGVSLRGTVAFRTDVRGALLPDGTKQFLPDGDFCSSCIETAINEGWPE